MIEQRGDVIYFDDGPPSNFHPAPVSLYVAYANREIELATSEHHFQLAKACLVDNPVFFQDIYEAPTASEAKRLGGRVPLSHDEKREWDEHIALETMVKCCIAKFRQNFDCWLWLQGTGDCRLVEHRRDRIWGNGLDGSGKNLLGLTLELVRVLTQP